MNTFDTPNSGTILNVDFWAMDNLIGLLKLVAEGRHYNTQVPIKYPNVAFDRIHHAERRPTLIKSLTTKRELRVSGIGRDASLQLHKPLFFFFYFIFFLPSMPLTAHSSRTGISFRQLALHVAPLARQGGEFFPLFNGMSFPFPERGRWKGEKWRPAGAEWLLHGGIPRTAAMPSHSQLVGDVMRRLPASVFWHWCTKPTELIVQLFAHAVTVSKTWWGDDCLCCTGSGFSGNPNNYILPGKSKG